VLQLLLEQLLCAYTYALNNWLIVNALAHIMQNTNRFRTHIYRDTVNVAFRRKKTPHPQTLLVYLSARTSLLYADHLLAHFK